MSKSVACYFAFDWLNFLKKNRKNTHQDISNVPQSCLLFVLIYLVSINNDFVSKTQFLKKSEQNFCFLNFWNYFIFACLCSWLYLRLNNLVVSLIFLWKKVTLKKNKTKTIRKDVTPCERKRRKYRKPKWFEFVRLAFVLLDFRST